MIMKVNTITTTDQCTTNAQLRKRDVYWQHRLETFFPDCLNERNKFARKKDNSFITAISLSVILSYFCYY